MRRSFYERSAKMDAVKRRTEMEQALDAGTAAVSRMEETLDELDSLKERIAALSDYYGSEEWFGDVEAHGEQRLPSELKCGVLSEDLVYNMIIDARAQAIRMLELAAYLLKKL